MEAGVAPIDSRRAPWRHPRAVPLAGSAVMAATLGFGLAASWRGMDLGSPTPPLLYSWRPGVSALAPVALAAVVACAVVAPRLCSPRLSPRGFAASALGLGLALRLGVAVAHDGIQGLYGVYRVPGFEGGSEYLPALPAFRLGTGFVLDTFAEIGTSLPVHAVGHPPGLLVMLHLLGIDTAEGMATLTIAVGALAVPLTYLLGRELLDEARARAATLLYAFAPSAVLGGASSADALYATLALVAAVTLLGRSRIARGMGPPALALASFFSYANLAVGAFATLLAARRHGLRHALVLAAGCAAALAAFYGGLHLATGFDPVGAARSAESVYREGVASGRPYGFWLIGSPVAFLIAAGLPIAWLALRSLGAGESVALGLFAVLAVAAVLGFTKAETERIYLFLVPLLCLAAAAALPARRLPAVLGALAVQALATEILFFTIW